MYEAKANPSDGYLLIRLEGMLQLPEAKAAVASILAEARRMKPPFTIISDIHEALPAPPDVAEAFKQGQMALYAMGAARVIRVVGNAATANLQFQRTQREAKVGYEMHSVRTLADARALHRKLSRATPNA